jgi:hypothetical protein
MGASVGDGFLVQTTCLLVMEVSLFAASGSDVSHRPLVRGSRVHVSDASPRGFRGRVTAVHPAALTVVRDDNGWWELVFLSRRHVMAVDQ